MHKDSMWTAPVIDCHKGGLSFNSYLWPTIAVSPSQVLVETITRVWKHLCCLKVAPIALHTAPPHDHIQEGSIGGVTSCVTLPPTRMRGNTRRLRQLVREGDGVPRTHREIHRTREPRMRVSQKLSATGGARRKRGKGWATSYSPNTAESCRTI